MKRRTIIFAVILVLLVQIVPFAFAISAGGSQHVFAGFLLNPVDGNSYLAKMQEGWSGSWQFTLPYTVNSGSGEPIFLFYLFLGHLAYWTGVSVTLMFHLARLLASAGLVVALAQFLGLVFRDDPKSGRNAFWLAVLGSGTGWILAILSGYLGGDFWVAEAYPFLSMYANPHFPLGLALILWIGCFEFGWESRFRPFWLMCMGLLLSMIQPFGLVIAGVLLFSRTAVRWVIERRLVFSSLLFCMILGGPYLIYQFVIIQRDPVLAQWNKQNITAALPVWDFALSLAPAIFLAALGGWRAWKSRKANQLALVVWMVVSILLVYLPFNLQRRFMTGLYVPVAALAIVGAEWLRLRFHGARRWMLPMLFILSIPTNIILLLSGIAGAQALSPVLYVSSAEFHAMNWIQNNTELNSVVLSSPEIGLYIPALTGRSVVYGHPFETVNAETEKGAVEGWFGEKMDPAEARKFIQTHHVAYVFVGPKEETLCNAKNCTGVITNQGGTQVYQEDGVSIYQIRP